MTTEPTLMKNLWRHLVTIAALVACTLSSAGTITYYHNDIAGSPIAATNESGAVLWRESYRPYGERLTNAPASTPNDVWFTSRRQDVDTELVYMGARYYDPVIGRFISTDPVGFEEKNLHTFNRYAYANNNPLKYKDPDGRNAALLGTFAVFGVGAAVGWNSMSDEQRDRVSRGLNEGLIQLGSGLRGLFNIYNEEDSDPKTDTGKAPPKGKEKDVADRGEPGEVREGQRRTREYGPDGRPVRDYDKPHPGHERPHVHEWQDGVREHPGRDYSPLPRGKD